MNKQVDIGQTALESDIGGRILLGSFSLKLSVVIALSWSLFQLWVSSPLPYFVADHLCLFRIDTTCFTKKILIDGTRIRYIHLSFAFLLAFVNFPMSHSLKYKNKIPIYDWGLAVLSTMSVLYLLVFYNDLALRSGLPTKLDVAFSVIGVICLLEATRRTLGPPLVVIAVIFLTYNYAGQYMPEILIHKGSNIAKISNHQWLTSNGIFGTALGVSANFIFLFVLFGSLLDKAGAGNYFIKVAFSLLGHLKGGPAKAAVLSSAMTGVISGSSIANVVTTGTFTIPLMRKVGFSKEKAGSIEVASSVNGQIMPPVMGAAAFLMVEYLAIPYTEIIKHAFIPAVISYIALLYIVHLEAIKFNMKSLKKRNVTSLKLSLLRTGIITSSIVIISMVFFYLFSFLRAFADGDYAIIVAILLIGSIYVWLVSIKAKTPDLEDDSKKEIIELPEVVPTVKAGLHFLLPIAVLIWCLMVERFSPSLAAFWAVVIMIFIILTQRGLTDFFRKTQHKNIIKDSFQDLSGGLVAGAKNMVAIAIATGTAGIIVGVVTQTGVSNKMTELVAVISGNSIMLMLLLTALICIILGMGLPTTANYIMVSSLMAGVVVELAKQNGLIVSLVAVHFFVFYFGIMADVTPPVGLASFAAAAISKGNPIKTSAQAFLYSIRTMVLPFIFIFDGSILLIGVDSFVDMSFIFIKSSIAILIFTAGTQGYFMVRSKLYESVLLVIIALSIFLPSFWINKIVPAFEVHNAQEIYKILDNNSKNKQIVLQLSGKNMFGEQKEFVIMSDFAKGSTAKDKLQAYGIGSVFEQNGKFLIGNIKFASKAYDSGIVPQFQIVNVQTEQKQPSDIWIYVISLLLLAIVIFLQRKRKKPSMKEIFI